MVLRLELAGSSPVNEPPVSVVGLVTTKSSPVSISKEGPLGREADAISPSGLPVLKKNPAAFAAPEKATAAAKQNARAKIRAVMATSVTSPHPARLARARYSKL